MLVALAVAAVVLLLVVLAVGLLDRRCAVLAERKAGAYLTAPLGDAATVVVHARPFLPQAIRGCYRAVEVRGTLRTGALAGAGLVAHLSDVRLPLPDLAGRRTRELPVGHVAGCVLLPYEVLARLSRIPGLVLEFDGERLMATATLPLPIPLPLPGLGQLARVGGEAVLTLGADGGVWLAVRNVSVAGFQMQSFALAQLLPRMTVPIPLPELPYGLRLDALTPTAAGLAVDGSADSVVLQRAEPAGQRPAGQRPAGQRPAGQRVGP